MFYRSCTLRPMDDKLTPADPHDIAESVAFALLFSGKKRVMTVTA